jgi:hypothetical protein
MFNVAGFFNLLRRSQEGTPQYGSAVKIADKGFRRLQGDISKLRLLGKRGSALYSVKGSDQCFECISKAGIMLKRRTFGDRKRSF